jgi:hypothetical protein
VAGAASRFALPSCALLALAAEYLLQASIRYMRNESPDIPTAIHITVSADMGFFLAAMKVSSGAQDLDIRT